MTPDLKSVGPETAIEVGPVASAPAGDKKLFVKSYGCQMNVYDAARMADVLAPEGYAETAVMEEADLIILNTCHIREKAADKVFSELGKVRDAQRSARRRRTSDQNRRRRLCRAGRRRRNSAQAARRRSRRRSAELSSFAGIVAAVRAEVRSSTRIFRSKTNSTIWPSRRTAKFANEAITAFLTVQEGCDKFCAFCVVPYTRGAENSRPVAKIIAEAETLARAGVREITLLGQNVNGYHGEGEDGRGLVAGANCFIVSPRSRASSACVT